MMNAGDPTLRYRPDIDGLRAVAIALVLAYHVAPVTFAGGFVGVDVFFVISGFLITRILMAEPGRFGRFYARRVRRLAPALLLVLVTTLVLGKATLLTSAFQELAKHTAAAAAFVANIVFWLESGYFDAAAIDKPLLHLWSLGIEEQFYLLWPLTLWWLLGRRGRAFKLTAFAAVVSFVACALMVSRSPDGAFYLPWFRLWEPLAGALIALSLGDAPSRRRAEILAWAGAALVVGGAVLLGRGAPFPSWTALAPVAGSAFLIIAGEQTWLARRVLSLKPVIGLGKISYPLYLWHWPLISLLADSHPTAGVGSRAMLCVAAIVLSTGTYRLVELPTRRSYRRYPRATVGALSVAVIAVTAVSLGLARSDPATVVAPRPDLAFLEQAWAEDVELRASLARESCDGIDGLPAGHDVTCRVAGSAAPDRRIVLWGDSTAESWAPLVETVARDRGVGSVVLSFSGCPPLFGVRGPLHADCELKDEAWKTEMIEQLQPSYIILSARWGAYANDTPGESRVDLHYVTTDPGGPATRESSRLALAETLPTTVARLEEIAPVTIIASVPDLLNRLPRAFLLGLDYGPTREQHYEFQREVTSLLSAVSQESSATIIDPAELLCVPLANASESSVKRLSIRTTITSRPRARCCFGMRSSSRSMPRPSMTNGDRDRRAVIRDQGSVSHRVCSTRP